MLFKYCTGRCRQRLRSIPSLFSVGDRRAVYRRQVGVDVSVSLKFHCTVGGAPLEFSDGYQLLQANLTKSTMGDPAAAILLCSSEVQFHSSSQPEHTPTMYGAPSHQAKNGPPESPPVTSPLPVSSSIASPSSSSS